MLSYVFMKLLERRPGSYDRRMDRISGGRVGAVKRAVAAEIRPGEHVLEVGCGTGELAAMLVQSGATVEGFDLSPTMAAAAQKRIEVENLEGRLTVHRMGVEGMDGLESLAYDAVVATLVFSELNDGERRFALNQAFRVLKPGGRLIVADEVVPRRRDRRILQALARAPMLAATYLITRTSTRPLADPQDQVAAAGFVVDKEVRSQGDAFALLVAHRPGEGAGG